MEGVKEPVQFEKAIKAIHGEWEDTQGEGELHFENLTFLHLWKMQSSIADEDWMVPSIFLPCMKCLSMQK